MASAARLAYLANTAGEQNQQTSQSLPAWPQTSPSGRLETPYGLPSEQNCQCGFSKPASKPFMSCKGALLGFAARYNRDFQDSLEKLFLVPRLNWIGRLGQSSEMSSGAAKVVNIGQS